MAIKWMYVDNMKGHKKLPMWKRSAALDDDTGEVFVPSSMVDQVTGLCALFDGITVLMDDKGYHYFPAEWVAMEYPDLKPVMERITSKVRTFFGFA